MPPSRKPTRKSPSAPLKATEPLGEAQPRQPEPSAPPPPPMPQPLRKIDEVARHVRASPATIARLVEDGTLAPAVVRVGKLVRFDLDRVMALLRQGKPKDAA